MAAAAAPPSVGSANPNEVCAAEISCTAGHNRSMPSEAQSLMNLATAAGGAGQNGAPFNSHQRANIGAARRRACASAANTGFVIARYRLALRSASWTPPIFLRSAINCTRRRRLWLPESISPRNSASKLLQRRRAFLQSEQREILRHLVDRHRLAVELSFSEIRAFHEITVVVCHLKSPLFERGLNVLEYPGTVRIDQDLTENLGAFVPKYQRTQRVVCGRHVGGVVRYPGF